MRFTKKDRYGRFYTNEANCRNIHSLDGKKLEGEFFENQTLVIDGNAIDKLGKLEDIEEELGIDLATLIKALKDGFYYKISFQNIKTGKIDQEIKYTDYCYFYYDNNSIAYFLATIDYQFYISSYGKDWALTREELETQEEN